MKKTVSLRMIMITVVVMGCMFFLGCSGAEKKAQDLYEIAAFEEQQFNYEHATELYNQIIQEYPDTATAPKAQHALERLDKTKKIK